MTDEFQFQLSVSLPPSEQFAKGDMVNVRGRNASEFLANLLDFDAQMAAEAGKVAANIRAQFAVARDLGGTVVERTAPQNSQVAPQQPASPQPGGYAPQQPPAPQNGADGFQNGQGYQPQQAPPQQYQQPQQPAQNAIPSSPPPSVGPPPSCSHGVKQFIAKPYKGGKPGYWMAWACPAQQGDPTQHSLEFIDQR